MDEELRTSTMTREELIALGERIVNMDGTEAEIDALFDRNVPHPAGSSLFFWSENYDFRNDDISSYDLTVEEVVDKCLAYEPTVLYSSKE